VPQWSAAPPRSLSMWQGEYGLHAEYFWMAIHPVTLLLLIGALITNWKNSRRKHILIVLGTYFLILVITSIYFVPELISLIQTPYQDTVDENLVSRSSQWEMLSIIRLLVLAVLCYILLSTLTRMVEVVRTNTSLHSSGSGAAPLAYPNDSLGG
jgi:cytochrome bd-type quinol oxidase subunit 2